MASSRRKRKAKRRRRRRLSPAGAAVVTAAAALLVLLIGNGIAALVHFFEKEEEPVAVEEIDPVHRNSYDWSRLDTSGLLYSYEDENWKSMAGIDVSYHQGEIDWNKAASSGIQFAMVRAGYRGYQEGQLHEDEQFRNNVRGAKDAGLSVGVYWFSQAVNVSEAEEEADYLLNLIQDENIDGPVGFDMEYVTDHDRISDLSQQELTGIAEAFLKKISAAGYKTLYYGSDSWLNNQAAMSQLQDLTQFWLASYHVSSPAFIHDFIMWQYADSGYIDGISGSVDLDLWFIRK